METNERETTFSRRQAVALGATGALTLMMAGCAPKAGTAEDAKALSFKPGTYTGSSEGRGGMLSVDVTFSENAIESVKLANHAETPFISDAALDELPALVTQYQSTGIDAVSGATVTSMAILAAVEDAASQAEGDVSALRKPAAVEKSTETKELECDVVVVGAGAGGMGAAVAAAEAGGKVVVVEKTSNIGGNAFVSGGLLEYIDAPQEVRAEMTPELEDYFNSLMAEAREGGASPEFLDKLQADHDSYYADGKKTVYDTTGLYALERCQVERAGDYSSITADTPVNDRESPFVKVAPWLSGLGMNLQTPLGVCFGYVWPNFTSPAETLGTGGSGYFDFFKKTFLDKGELDIQVLTRTTATELVMDNGAVTGVKAVADDGTAYTVTAKRGTILATGGYSANQNMLKEYNTLWSWDADTEIPTDNTAGHMGDGIVMALAVGGHVDGMGTPELFPTVDLKQHIIENIVCDGPMLNKEGVRFVDEMGSRFDMVEAMLEQTDHMTFIPADSMCVAVTEDGLTMGGWGPAEATLLERGQLLKADTLEELAEMAGIDKNVFVDSVEKWNAMLITGEDPDCGRTIFTNAFPIETPPFYMSPATFAAHATQGGVVVDENGQALTEDGKPIAGLYCVGELVFDRLGVRSIGEGMDVAQKLMA